MSQPRPPPIENFSELIEPYLNGGKLESYESEYFTAPGDNYGSTIFKVAAQIIKENGKKDQLDLIAKLIPSNELFLQIFEPERTFRTELGVYQVLAPAFIRLQKDAGIPDADIANVFADCYGGRISLDKNANKVDAGAALILKNVGVNGYKMGDRLEGFDYETTLVILRDLARFHAMSVGYRLKHPEEFNNKVKPFAQPFSLDTNVPEEMHLQLVEDNLAVIKDLPGMDDAIFEKVLIAFSIYDEHIKNLKPCPDTLFSAVAHNDFWTNNILIRYNDGKPKDIKILDFQAANYDSVVHDVVFFLLLCVQMDIAKSKFDELLKVYYDNFVGWLNRLGCNTNKYSYEKFYKEVQNSSAIELQHIVLMHKVLSLRKDRIPNADYIDGNHLLNQAYFHDNFHEKLWNIIELYEKKGLFGEQPKFIENLSTNI